MERDPLTVLEEMGVSLSATPYDSIVYLSVAVDGRYFCEDLAGDSLADLREAAARLLATVENPPPLPPPPEPEWPSSPRPWFDGEMWRIEPVHPIPYEGVSVMLLGRMMRIEPR